MASCLAYSLILKMDATCSSEMSGDIQWTVVELSTHDKSCYCTVNSNLQSYLITPRMDML
jgi:hypothetical protein